MKKDTLLDIILGTIGGLVFAIINVFAYKKYNSPIISLKAKRN